MIHFKSLVAQLQGASTPVWALLWFALAAAVIAWRSSRSSGLGRFLGKGKWVLITGAGSGFGRQAAIDFAKTGSSLALWDINAVALDNVKEEVLQLPGFNGDVTTQVVDVSNAHAVETAAAAVLKRCPTGAVDVVISNAGVVSGKDIDEMSDGDVQRTFGVNVFASFSLVRALLPAAKAARHGCFVFTASVMGMCGSAKLGDYCASKFALMGFAESMRLELQRDGFGGGDIPVITVCPYAAGTGMFGGIFAHPKAWNPLRSLLFPILEAGQVSGSMLKAVAAGRDAVVYVPGHAGFFINVARSWLPLFIYDRFVGWMGGWHGMSAYTGRAQPATTSSSLSAPLSADEVAPLLSPSAGVASALATVEATASPAPGQPPQTAAKESVIPVLAAAPPATTAAMVRKRSSSSRPKPAALAAAAASGAGLQAAQRSKSKQR